MMFPADLNQPIPGKLPQALPPDHGSFPTASKKVIFTHYNIVRIPGVEPRASR